MSRLEIDHRLRPISNEVAGVVTEGIMKGVWNMEESVVYQDIIRKGEIKGHDKGRTEGRTEGRIESSRSSILLFGGHFFGEATEWQKAELKEIANPDRLDRMMKSIPKQTSWEELLRIA